MTIDPLQVVLVVFAVLAWFLRCEGRIKALEKDIYLTNKRIDDLHTDHKALAEKVVIDLITVKEALARIEAVLRMSDDK